MTDKRDYEIGYCKPPRHSQFKKGQSGNPRGRPRGARGIKTDLREELSQRVRITENGRTLNLTKQQLVIKALVAKAAKGDPRAATQVFALTLEAFGIEGERAGSTRLHPEDQAILDAFLRRNSGGDRESP